MVHRPKLFIKKTKTNRYPFETNRSTLFDWFRLVKSILGVFVFTPTYW